MKALIDKISAVFGRSPPRGNKVEKFFGNEVPSFFKERSAAAGKPWYLRPVYDSADIQIDTDGTVKAGTVSGLVDRLTAHEHGGMFGVICGLN